MRNYLTILESIMGVTTINEAGAGGARIVDHINQGKPFVLVSAERKNLSAEENSKRISTLRNVLSEHPAISFINSTGEYEGDLERSFFILQGSKSNPKNFINFGKKLGKLYNQDAIIYGDGVKVYLWYCDSDDTIDIGDAATFSVKQINDLGNGWTNIKSSKFAFTNKEKVPDAMGYGGNIDYKNRKADEFPLKTLSNREREIPDRVRPDGERKIG